MRDIEIINIIAEQLTNEFPDVNIENVVEKAERLYKIMRLKQRLPEIKKAKEALEKLLDVL